MWRSWCGNIRTMTLSDDARRLFEALPLDNSKVGGITLQRQLDIGKLAYRDARDELRQAGLVEVGGGRGGSLGRKEGAELLEEQITTQAQRLEFAREAKKTKSLQQKYHDEIRDIAYSWCRENLGYEIRKPSEVHLSYGRILVAVWRDDGSHMADMIQIPQLEVDKMKAKYVR